MKKFAAFLTLALALTGAAPAHAQRVSEMPGGNEDSAFNERIIAVVNDNVITSTDLGARVAMAFISSGLPDVPEVRERITLQVLHGMVDEQLELQEAKKQDITVPQKEIDEAMTRIAQENHLPTDMRGFLESRGIPPEALEEQIRASLAWNRVIQRELRPLVEVSDDEIDAALDRMKAEAGKEQYQLGEIFLAVDNAKDEDRVRALADNLVQQIKQGANFGAVARQFSQNASAASGGDIGWMTAAQLPTELGRALRGAHPGDIVGPVRSASGYHILGLRAVHVLAGGKNAEPTVELQQLYHPFGPGQDRDALLAEASNLRTTLSGCRDLAHQVAAQFSDWRWKDLGTKPINSLPAWLVSIARNQDIGKPGDALATGQGALIVFVCDRQIPEGLPDRDTITNQIGTEKLELQARRLLRDLRRAAYLDLRIVTPG